MWRFTGMALSVRAVQYIHWAVKVIKVCQIILNRAHLTNLQFLRAAVVIPTLCTPPIHLFCQEKRSSLHNFATHKKADLCLISKSLAKRSLLLGTPQTLHLRTLHCMKTKETDQGTDTSFNNQIQIQNLMHSESVSESTGQMVKWHTRPPSHTGTVSYHFTQWYMHSKSKHNDWFADASLILSTHWAEGETARSYTPLFKNGCSNQNGICWLH